MPNYEPALRRLQNIAGIQLSFVDKVEERKRNLPTDLVKDCELLFCTFPPENHIEMERLKLILISSAGFTQLAGQSFDERGIRACNALGVFDVPIAEWNIAMMINLARDMKGMLHNQDAKIWDRSPRFQQEIRRSVVGLWGYGGIGRETARLAKTMGMNVHVLGRSQPKSRLNVYNVAGTGDISAKLPDRFYTMDEIEEFLNGIDFLVMAIPQIKDTVGIVGEAELRMLSPHAFVLNPARGPLIDEKALIKALQEKWIAGAALDTHFHYQLPPEHPLSSMPNVIITPHISGSSASNRFLERTWDIFYQNVKRYMTGDELLNELTTTQLKG